MKRFPGRFPSWGLTLSPASTRPKRLQLAFSFGGYPRQLQFLHDHLMRERV
jgi:hypothetical protein